MIVVSIEVWPKGDRALRRAVALATIANAGGTEQTADYHYALWQAGDADEDAPDPRTLANGQRATRTGLLRRFSRVLGAVHLVADVLGAAVERMPFGEGTP